MKRTLRACLQALMSALTNGVVALALMLLMEFCISGNLRMYLPYVYAAGAISVIIFFITLPRQLSYCSRNAYCTMNKTSTTPTKSSPFRPS
ncbi:hypothetical protein [Mangrovitalea sediminis]|uniref:hypothetical protein n=1 Tax=Mangrovitalea sediminis TaxID=1982043 RepID=UPI000BE4E0C8|nr:hypothetical protein [Mangrovitalea sediminis]